ncbi:MAG: hypothetical protein ACWGSQ_11560 [Longimicrobiales bacterium]
MPLDDLRKQGLLLPEGMWGHRPQTTLRSRVSVLLTFGVGLLSAWMIWAGAGGWVTFLGVGIFLLDLLLILVTTFLAVNTQVDSLQRRGLAGKVEGLESGSEG